MPIDWATNDDPQIMAVIRSSTIPNGLVRRIFIPLLLISGKRNIYEVGMFCKEGLECRGRIRKYLLKSKYSNLVGMEGGVYDVLMDVLWSQARENMV
jgi:hypothetical protein